VSSLDDVLVIGGGPAGATAAILLARAGRRVAICERDQDVSPHLPETHLGLSRELLARLGIEDVVRRSLGAPAPVSYRRLDAALRLRIDVTPEPSEDGTGLTLDRTTFDALLLERAAAEGAEVRRGVTVESLVFPPDGPAIVRCTSGGTRVEHRARFVLDASGKMAAVRKALALPVRTQKLDPRVAVFSHYADHAALRALAPAGMTVASFEDGYFLVANMDTRFSVIAILGEAAARRAGAAPAQIFHAAIARWPELASAVAGARALLPVIPAMNESIECEQVGGQGYLLLGDAASFVDPFFCPGLSTAIEMGVLAADTVAACPGAHLAAPALAAYDADARALLARKRRAPYEWLDGAETARAFADPHVPWILPAFVLGLLSGGRAGGVEHVARRARDAYAALS
jgi:flavin-dependent dehydrogenase